LLSQFIDRRYASYQTDLGQRILSGKAGFDDLEAWVLEQGEPRPISGRQEYLENLINTYL
jgi:xylose isomerase